MTINPRLQAQERIPHAISLCIPPVTTGTWDLLLDGIVMMIVKTQINDLGDSNQFFQRGDRLYTSESDVCRRQILAYKVDPRTKRIKIFLTAVDP